MVAQRMIEDFPGREPVWGWRHDTQEIMERQIDLAADNGIDFFLFCWYWRDDKGSCSSMHGMNGWKVVTCYPTCNMDMGTLKR